MALLCILLVLLAENRTSSSGSQYGRIFQSKIKILFTPKILIIVKPVIHLAICCRNVCLNTCIWKHGNMIPKNITCPIFRYMSSSTRNMCPGIRNRKHVAIHRRTCPQIRVSRDTFLQHNYSLVYGRLKATWNICYYTFQDRLRPFIFFQNV